MISMDGNFNLYIILKDFVCSKYIIFFTHIFLTRTRKRVVIIMVLIIPTTVDTPITEILAISAD